MVSTGRMSIGMQQLAKFLLMFGFIIGNTYQEEQISTYECYVKELPLSYFPMLNVQQRTYMNCDHIDTAEKVRSAKWFITDKLRNINSMQLYQCNIDLFPDDIFPTYNVTKIDFQSCKMAGIPSRLLQPLCPSLQYIRLFGADLQNKSIPAEAFGNCKQLQEIWIPDSGIATVSRKAFSGLADLRKLHLHANAMESFEGFEGIHNLEELYLDENKIRFIDQNAFRGLNKLTRLYLSSNKLTTLAEGVFDGLSQLTRLGLGYNKLTTLTEGVFDAFINSEGVFINLAENPFYCDCTLKWLQNWLQKSGTTPFNSALTREPECAGPMEGSLRTLNFCNITTTELPKTEGTTHGLTTTLQSLPEGPGHTSNSQSWSIGLPLYDHILIVVNHISSLLFSSLG